MVVEVWDDASGHIVGASHDFIDKYTSTLDNGRIIYPDVKSSKEKTEKLCGKRSCMIVTITLYCGPNFLVPDSVTTGVTMFPDVNSVLKAGTILIQIVLKRESIALLEMIP